MASTNADKNRARVQSDLQADPPISLSHYFSHIRIYLQSRGPQQFKYIAMSYQYIKLPFEEFLVHRFVPGLVPVDIPVHLALHIHVCHQLIS